MFTVEDCLGIYPNMASLVLASVYSDDNLISSSFIYYIYIYIYIYYKQKHLGVWLLPICHIYVEMNKEMGGILPGSLQNASMLCSHVIDANTNFQGPTDKTTQSHRIL